MRSTIIPAQITTVEDKIAGSLSMSQILLMVAPVIWATLIYAVLIPQMKLPAYKWPLIGVSSLICFTAALRIKEKIILEWVVVLLRYTLRPRLYLYNKNSLYERQIDLPIVSQPSHIAKKAHHESNSVDQDSLSIAEMIKLETVMNSGRLAVNFNFKEK